MRLSFISRRSAGFTLIELLVVIAIIGILSAVVLASLNTARSKGSDAAIKSDLNSSRTQAELFFDVNGNSYANICTNTTVSTVKSIYTNVAAAGSEGGVASVSRNAAGGAGIAACNDSGSAWAAQVPLRAVSGSFYCVDSTGYATTTSSNKLANGTDYLCT